MDFFDEMEEIIGDAESLMSTPPKTLRNTEALTDESPMPFGKYKKRGLKMKDVPARYLLWWQGTEPTHNFEVLAYICKNQKSLEEEAESLGNKGESDREYGECWDRFPDEDIENDHFHGEDW